MPSDDIVQSDAATAVVTHPDDQLPDDELPVDAEDGVDPTADSAVSDPVPVEVIP